MERYERDRAVVMMRRTIITSIGQIEILCDEKYLLSLRFTSKKNYSDHSEQLDRCETQIKEYFKGERKKFNLPLKLEGTDFQKRVWEEIFKIPFGETSSYLEIAKRIGKPGAARAVGGAAGANGILLIIPCHRVIATNGSIGGFSSGLSRKRKLLALEEISI